VSPDLNFLIIATMFLSGSECVQDFYHLIRYELPFEIQSSNGRVEIQLTGLNPPHICARPMPKSGFPT